MCFYLTESIYNPLFKMQFCVSRILFVYILNEWLYVICCISNKQYQIVYNKCLIDYIVKSKNIVFYCSYKWIFTNFFH